MHLRHSARVAALLLALAPRIGHSQRVLGPGEDAWTLPAGIVRIGLGARFFGASELFGADGRLSIGAPYSGALGASTFAPLQDLETTIGGLTGNSAFRATIGTTRANLRQSRAAIPLDIAIGIAPRITARVTAPFFTGEFEAQWLIDTAGATVGANPEFLVFGASPNASLISGLDTAASRLEFLADDCIADAMIDPRCPLIIAEMNEVRALIAQSRAMTDAIARTYGGRPGVTGSMFVPRADGAAHTTITSQITGLRTAFDHYGTESVAEGAAPFAATAPPTITELERMLTDSAFGYALAPFHRRYAQGIGDIDVGLVVTLLDGIGANNPWHRDSAQRGGLRQSFAFTYRLGTGTGPDPDDPFKLPTGDGQNDIEITSITDIVSSRRFWTTLVFRWTKQEGYDGIARIPDGSGSPFIPIWRRRNARTELGDRIEGEIAPRLVVNEYMAFGARYRFTRQDALTVTELAPFTDAIPLSFEGEPMTAHEVGLGFSWSAVSAWRGGRAKWPIEVQWERSLVVAGDGGAVRFSADRISLRAYARLWGK